MHARCTAAGAVHKLLSWFRAPGVCAAICAGACSHWRPSPRPAVTPLPVAAAKGGTELRIADQVTVTHVPPDASLDAGDEHGQVVLQWESSPHADCTADAVVATLLQEQGPPASIGVAEAARKCGAASRAWPAAARTPACRVRCLRAHAVIEARAVRHLVFGLAM